MAQSPQNRLRADQVSVGAPLPFDAYDSRGVLLLRQGSIILSQAQLERLIDSGLYGDEPGAADSVATAGTSAAAVPTTQRVSVIGALTNARSSLETAWANADPATFGDALTTIARQVRAATLLDPDAAIGNVVASRGAPYPARHAVNCACIGTLLLTRQAETDADIDDCLCAILTMNLSIIALQATLYAQKEPLSADQREANAAHPARSVAMLRERGVESPTWLAAVEQHHEALDGSGYPAGIQGEAIGRHARVLAIADQYCALVSERSFRQGVNPGAALRHLLVSQGQGLDPGICALLIRELTPYPPGAAVRLANGEIAIVTRRTHHPEHPIVRAVAAGDGRLHPEPRKRVTSQDVYRVVKPLPQGEIRQFPVAEHLWDDAYQAAGA